MILQGPGEGGIAAGQLLCINGPDLGECVRLAVLSIPGEEGMVLKKNGVVGSRHHKAVFFLAYGLETGKGNVVVDLKVKAVFKGIDRIPWKPSDTGKLGAILRSCDPPQQRMVRGLFVKPGNFLQQGNIIHSVLIGYKTAGSIDFNIGYIRQQALIDIQIGKNIVLIGSVHPVIIIAIIHVAGV